MCQVNLIIHVFMGEGRGCHRNVIMGEYVSGKLNYTCIYGGGMGCHRNVIMGEYVSGKLNYTCIYGGRQGCHRNVITVDGAEWKGTF